MEKQPLVSIVIPTHNRPELVRKAIESVLGQTFRDFEIIIIDDGQEKRAKEAVLMFADDRIRYVAHDKERGCSGAKNTGIREAKGKYVAFLDDDDTWSDNKLSLQIEALKDVPADVAYSFTAVTDVFDDRETERTVPDGIGNYYEYALRVFNGMLSSALIIRRDVFDDIGLLSEEFPSHTDIDLMLRVSRKYRGVGVNKSLVRRIVLSGHEQMGSSWKRRIAGREMLLEKYKDEFEARPLFLAKHLTFLAVMYRSDGQYKKAREIFKRTLQTKFTPIRLAYYLSMFGNGFAYKIFRKIKGV